MMKTNRHWRRIYILGIVVAVLSGCGTPHPTVHDTPSFRSARSGSIYGVNWTVHAVMFTNGTTIRSLRLNYGFTHPETSPSLYRSTDRMRFEARDPPICESLPCSASVNNPTGQINPTFFAPGDNLPANQVVHFNIEVGYTLPNDTTVRKWWSPTQTSPTTGN
jgi:hypothetical protein